MTEDWATSQRGYRYCRVCGSRARGPEPYTHADRAHDRLCRMIRDREDSLREVVDALWDDWCSDCGYEYGETILEEAEPCELCDVPIRAIRKARDLVKRDWEDDDDE